MKKFPRCEVTVGKKTEGGSPCPIRHLSLASVAARSRRGHRAAPSRQLRLRAGAGHWCQCHTSTEMDPPTPSRRSMQRSRSIFPKARGIQPPAGRGPPAGFLGGGESSFNDGTTQTALDPLGRGGRFAPIKSSNYGGRPLTGPRPDDLSVLRLVEWPGWVNE